MSRLSDITLIAQVVATGSHRAFGQLVEAHQEPVRRFLRRLTGGDEMLADDLAQETFIRAWERIGTFRQLSGFETWLLRIAYRVFLDEKRKAVVPEAEQTREPSESSGERWSLHHDLDQALATLSETERTCVVLQCIEGQSIREISQITGIPENTVKSHLLRGKKNLANYLRKNGY